MSITYEWELRDASDDSVVASGVGLPPTSDTPGSALAEGSYYLWVQATDEGGATTAVSSIVEVDDGYPDPSDVLAGVVYGPNGEYTGTLTPGSSGPIGPGGIPVTIPVTSNNQPVDGVAVWITTDAEGTHQIAGTLFTSTFGLVNFMLEPGIFYVWVQKAGINFLNPQAIQVLENGTYQWYTG